MGGVPCSALMKWGRALVQPQFNVPSFLDSPWEALSFGRSGWEMGSGKREEKVGGGVGGLTVDGI